VVYLDADMLVMQPLSRIAMAVSYDALHDPQASAAAPMAARRWFLHGSAPSGAAGTMTSAIQIGFMAFVQPAPAELSAELTSYCDSIIARNRVKSNLDQDVVRYALLALGLRYEPKRFNRSKAWRVRPRQLFLHRDWQTNYFPVTREAIAEKRVLHWAGHPKPWACPGRRREQTLFATNGKGRSQEFYAHMRGLWQDACKRAVSGGCVSNGWLAAVCTPSCASQARAASQVELAGRSRKL